MPMSRRTLKQSYSCHLLSHLFLGLVFDPEDGGDMFFRNIGSLSADYAVLYPKR
jgi:hypothetical protein